MICLKTIRQYCKDDITKIENYDMAINDDTQTWHCHHRLEMTLDNEFALSQQDLIRFDMYYNRPYFELIFLTEEEHYKLHKLASPQCGSNNYMFGKHHSDETRLKLSISNLGKNKGNVSVHKGKHWKLINGKRTYY